MESRMRKYGVQASPDRSKPAPVPKQVSRKIPVVYYLCRNRHLEHPHFIEVPISSHEGLYLRDVIKRLNELRGKGMPSIYSWSCKRTYKNGFVWHDLSEDDLILPVNGNEYVLKGSELLDQSPPDRSHNASSNPKSQNLKAPPQPETPSSSKSSHPSSSSSPPAVTKEAKTLPLPPPPPNQEDARSPNRPQFCDSGSPGTLEFRVYKPTGAADASTQTDDSGKQKNGEKAHSTCTRGVSTDDSPPPEFEIEEDRQIPAVGNEISPLPTSLSAASGGKMETLEGGLSSVDAVGNEISPLPTSSSAASGGKMETLESLIRADARKINSFRVLEEEEVFVPTGPKLRATNLLMQLITCGSLSVKDHHSFGLVPTYKTRFSHMKFPSPMFAGSMVLGEFDCLSDNSKMMGLRMEDKEYFSGSLIETKKHKEIGEGVATLKRSSSFNADRDCTSPDSKCDKDKVVDSSRSKCLPRTIKITAPSKHYRNGMMRSPMSECPRISSAGLDSGQSSQAGSKRITDGSSVQGSSMRLESLKEKEKVIKIEERLTSGARVIIQSRATRDESEDSSSS